MNDVLNDALSNLEHDNYERSHKGYENRQADIALIRAALAAQPAASAEPVAYAAFADNGNIRIWSREPLNVPGCVPLYTAPTPPAQASEQAAPSDEHVSVVGMPEFDALLDHIYEHGTTSEGVRSRADALARALLSRYGQAAAAAGDARDREDAERYRLLRRKVCIVGESFHIINIKPTYVAPDAAAELDAAIDAAIDQAREKENGND